MNTHRFSDLNVRSKSLDPAMGIFKTVGDLSKEEQLSLSSQVVRPSGSVSADKREGYAKRYHEQRSDRHPAAAVGSSEDTRRRAAFAFQCKHFDNKTFEEPDQAFAEASASICSLQKNRNKRIPSQHIYLSNQLHISF